MPARLARSAFELFSQHGIQQVSLDDIARHAGVTKGSLYWHYHSKDDVIKAACTHYYRLYHRRMNGELASIADPTQRLDQALQLSVRACLLDDKNRIFTTEIFSLALKDQEVRRGWQQFYDSVREFYVGLMAAAHLNGQASPCEIDQTVDFMLATMEGIKLQALFDPKLCSADSEKSILRQLKRILGFPAPVS